MSRDDGDVKEGISRRGFVKGALAMGVAGAAVAGGAFTLRSLVGNILPDVQETFLYVSAYGAPDTPWWIERGLVGEEARFSHFKIGSGANVSWRWYLDANRNVVAGASVLLMRVSPEKLEFPEGYPRDEFVVDGLYAVFNVCPHAGCSPSWKLVPRHKQCDDPGYETIFCPCHYSHFHSTRMSVFTHPGPPAGSGATYLGVAEVSGPSGRGMPLIPIELQGDHLIGKLKEPDWYRYLDTMRRPLP